MFSYLSIRRHAKVQLLLLGSSPKVYIVIMQCPFKKCVAEIRVCSQTLKCAIN